MKKLFLSLLVALLPLVASAENVKIGDLWYEVISKIGEATVIKSQDNSKYSGKVVIPESVIYNDKTYSVTSIGSSAFRSCNGLTSVTIGNSVTSIGNSAFNYCLLLTSVTIGNSVTSIDSYAFEGCSGLTSIAIPNSVTSIGSSAFSKCSGLTSVTIGNSVTSIGSSAFSSCNGLTTVEIPNSVTSIGNYAFRSCSGLTSIAIPNSVTSIGSYAFEGCSRLTSIEIPNSVTSIGSCAFSSCSGLTSIAIPNNVTSIGSSAFSSCSGLTSIEIPNSVTSIGSSAFEGCSGLTSIEIPNSVTSIGYNAFSKCSGLTSVTIGNSVTSIGDKAFANCAEITNVYCLAEKVPSTNSNAFENSYIEYVTLHVPASSIEKYKATTPWSSFGKVVTLESGDVQEPEICAVPTITYQNGKLVFGCETEGAEFVSEITDADIKKHFESEISLTATYNISVYATKEGYKNSEVAKATLCWIDVEPKTEGVVETEISNVKALPVMVQVNGGMLTVNGADDGTMVEVYTIAGAKVGNAVTSANTATINVSQLTDNVIIVKVGGKAIKMTLK